jgi:inhibitor of cysteine peptidase
MFKKITLILISIFLLASMAGCRNDPMPEVQTPVSENEAQESQGGTMTETNPPENQEELPIFSGNDANIAIGAEANGTTQQMKVGEVMVVTLESNPSTGYAWHASSSNPDVVAQMGDAQYQEPASTSNEPLLGAAGTEILSFEATGSGTATLTLDYKRGWENGTVSDQTIIITVVVG